MAWVRPTASTTARGYGTAHQRLRAQWKPRVDAGLVNCWRCGRNLRGITWHLGHDDNDRTKYRGPECAACNLTAAARKAARIAWAGKRKYKAAIQRSHLTW